MTLRGSTRSWRLQEVDSGFRGTCGNFVNRRPSLLPLVCFFLQMAQRKIRDILAQVKQLHQKGQSNQAQARRK